MRTTYWQPPNMKGKKFYLFSCGCCWARNCREEIREKIDIKEAADEVASTDPNGRMEKASEDCNRAS